MASHSFVCSICGAEHIGLPTDRAYTLPDIIWALPEAERANVAKWHSDLCQMGDDYFIRCLLPIPFLDQPGDFGWGVWAKVERSTFDHYLAVYERDATEEPEVRGWLANAVPGHETSFDTPILIRFGTSTQRPTARFPKEAQHDFAREQALGMSNQRYHELLEMIGAI